MSVLIDPRLFTHFRHQSRLSQQALRVASRVSITTIKRIEGAKRSYPCRPLQAERLAQALGVSVEAFTDAALEIDIGGDILARVTKETSEEEIREGLTEIGEMIVRNVRRLNQLT